MTIFSARYLNWGVFIIETLRGRRRRIFLPTSLVKDTPYLSVAKYLKDVLTVFFTRYCL